MSFKSVVLCALCEEYYDKSELVGQITFKAIVQWRQQHKVPLDPSNKRLSFHRMHRVVKLCRSCNLYFDKNYNKRTDPKRIEAEIFDDCSSVDHDKMKKRFDNKIQELSNDNPTEADISTAYKMRKRQALLGQMDEEVFENLHPKNKMSFNPHMKLQLEIDSLKTKRNLQTHHTNVIDTKSTPSFLRRKYNNVKDAIKRGRNYFQRMAIKQPKSVKLFQIQKFVMKKQTTNQRDFIKENALDKKSKNGNNFKQSSSHYVNRYIRLKNDHEKKATNEKNNGNIFLTSLENESIHSSISTIQNNLRSKKLGKCRRRKHQNNQNNDVNYNRRTFISKLKPSYKYKIGKKKKRKEKPNQLLKNRPVWTVHTATGNYYSSSPTITDDQMERSQSEPRLRHHRTKQPLDTGLRKRKKTKNLALDNSSPHKQTKSFHEPDESDPHFVKVIHNLQSSPSPKPHSHLQSVSHLLPNENKRKPLLVVIQKNGLVDKTVQNGRMESQIDQTLLDSIPKNSVTISIKDKLLMKRNRMLQQQQQQQPEKYEIKLPTATPEKGVIKFAVLRQRLLGAIDKAKSLMKCGSADNQSVDEFTDISDPSSVRENAQNASFNKPRSEVEISPTRCQNTEVRRNRSAATPYSESETNMSKNMRYNARADKQNKQDSKGERESDRINEDHGDSHQSSTYDHSEYMSDVQPLKLRPNYVTEKSVDSIKMIPIQPLVVPTAQKCATENDPNDDYDDDYEDYDDEFESEDSPQDEAHHPHHPSLPDRTVNDADPNYESFHTPTGLKYPSEDGRINAKSPTEVERHDSDRDDVAFTDVKMRSESVMKDEITKLNHLTAATTANERNYIMPQSEADRGNDPHDFNARGSQSIPSDFRVFDNDEEYTYKDASITERTGSRIQQLRELGRVGSSSLASFTLNSSQKKLRTISSSSKDRPKSIHYLDVLIPNQASIDSEQMDAYDPTAQLNNASIADVKSSPMIGSVSRASDVEGDNIINSYRSDEYEYDWDD